VSYFEAIILGIVQGLTEFLPISSTAHLRIVPTLCGWDDPGAAFTAVIQLGTLFAVLIYFEKDIRRLTLAWLVDFKQRKYGTSHDSKLAWMIAVATIPIVLGGLLLKKLIESQFRHLDFMAGFIFIFALLLWGAEYRSKRRIATHGPGRNETQIDWFDAIFMGCWQMLALLPGASRSGTTITAGLLTGLDRSTAARFSFLLSLPAITAAGVYSLYKERKVLLATEQDIAALLIATAVSFIVGYLSIAFLLSFLKRYSTHIFIFYRILLAIGLVVLLQQGVLQPTTGLVE
jgi:undecaprenyl-diphosphatase